MQAIKDIALKFRIGTIVSIVAALVLGTWIVSTAFARTNTKVQNAMEIATANREAIRIGQIKTDASNEAVMKELSKISNSIVRINTILDVAEINYGEQKYLQ